ncbi:MAG: Gfo/Idh/MocA family oxidoreductase [Lachnospiraceae bacterium]|nr:Gfo/Idh/MocA family oxidoreductase [Lachnospiraceae bacterium]
MNFSILAAGSIAHKMAEAVTGISDEYGIVCHSVASRDIERAQQFADKWGFKKAYGSYEEMLSDPEVELVYVASPHSLHYEHAKMCLEHGKHVLVEKPFTVNAKQAEELIALAKDKKLLLVEAMWTRFMPSRTIISEVISSGVVGKPISLTANLGYYLQDKERLVNPSLAGGALLDVGVYPINFAMMAIDRDITRVESSAVMSDNGVDESNSVTLVFTGGEMAVLHSTMMTPTDRRGIICCEDGYIEVENINNCEGVKVYDRDHKLIEERDVPEQINGYEYEVLSCRRALLAGETECEEMPLAETLRVMKLLDKIRGQWGMRYPME